MHALTTVTCTRPHDDHQASNYYVARPECQRTQIRAQSASLLSPPGQSVVGEAAKDDEA